MTLSAIEHLREGYEGKYVAVDSDREELARFKGLVGQVATVNCNDRALVVFDHGEDQARYDIEIDYLKVVDKPNQKTSDTETTEKPVETTSAPEKLSSLEVARMEKGTP